MKRVIFIIQFFTYLLISHAQQVKSFVTSDDAELYYTIYGKGEKVVFLSGGPGFNAHSLSHWADSLSNDFECVLFDQRGTGLSKNVNIDSLSINLSRAIKDLDDLRKHLGVEKFTLCGFSWGGMLSQAYAACYPEKIKKIILVSTFGPDLSLKQIFFNDNLKMRMYPEERDSLMYWNNKSDSEQAFMKRAYFTTLPYFFNHELGAEVLPGLFSRVSFNPRVSSLMWKDLNKNYDLNSKLKRYQGECIIVRPRQDPIPVESIYQINKLLPQVKTFFIESCGHFPGLEQPDRFYSILRSIL